MQDPLKNPESMYDIIFKAVTKKREDVQKTATQCKQLFKQGASPEVLTQLEETLKARQDEEAIAKHTTPSEQGNSPKIPDELKESLKTKKEDYEYYIQKFLPALKEEITNSKKLDSKKKAIIVQTILDITNRSSDKDHSSSTIQNQKGRRNNQTDRQNNALGLFKNKSFFSEVAVAESSCSSAWESDSLAKGVSGKGTPGTYKTLDYSAANNSSYNGTLKVPTLGQVRTLEASKETSLNPIAQSQLDGSFSQYCEDLENKDPSTTADAVEVLSSAKTSKLSNDNGSDSGIDSRELSATSTSSEESLNSIPSVDEENNDPKTENEEKTKLTHPTKTRPKGLNGRRSPSKHHEKIEDLVQLEQAAPEEPQVQESGNSDGQADPNQVKEELSQVSLQQVTEARGEESKIPVSRTGMTDAITTMQKPPVNEKKGEDTPLKKQPNNRNLRGALVAGCALSTIGCIVAGVMTSGLVGAGLLAMAAVFAIAAVAELHSNFLSSKLTSINVEPHVNDKELTECSHL